MCLVLHLSPYKCMTSVYRTPVDASHAPLLN